MQSAPDQSDAETARLNRYEGAALEQEAANNRTSLNAFNRENDPYYNTPSYENWPDQTDAESARLNRYEANARDAEYNAQEKAIFERKDRDAVAAAARRAAAAKPLQPRASAPASDSDVVRTLLALANSDDASSNAMSTLKARGGLAALPLGNSKTSSDVRGGPATFGAVRGYGELTSFQKDLAAFGSDLPKVPYNLAVNTVEAAMNFIGSGALPGYPDYVPALDPLKIHYNSDLSAYTEFGLGLAIAGVARTNSLPDAPVGSNGTANAVTMPMLRNELLTQQAFDPRIGTTLEGAAGPIKVTADASVGRLEFFDTNQTARPSAVADPNRPTLIADLVPPKDPNSNMANAHAEVGVIQQAYERGVTRGADMSIVVRGQEPLCSYCASNVWDMAARAELNSLKLIDTAGQAAYFWSASSGQVVRVSGAHH
jgi:hypothetical protein